VQEIFGVNDHIKRVADGFAADGFLAIDSLADALLEHETLDEEGA